MAIEVEEVGKKYFTAYTTKPASILAPRHLIQLGSPQSDGQVL